MRSFALAKRKKKHKTKRRREDIERFSSKLPLSDNATSFPNNAAAFTVLLLVSSYLLQRILAKCTVFCYGGQTWVMSTVI